jgi:hypothetical protein
MKDKRYQYPEDVFNEYIELTNQQVQVPVLPEMAREKYNTVKLEKWHCYSIR